MSSKKAKELASLVWPKEDVEGIENLADDLGNLFFGKAIPNPKTGVLEHNVGGFWDRFPQYNETNLPETDLDALEHYYGQALAQHRYGTMPALLAGLFNEVRGTYRGNRVEGTIVDLINNFSALSPDFTGEQEKYVNIVDSLISNPNYTPTNNQLQNLINHALEWTVDPPEREMYGRKK
tara:strand:- start:36 stop:572 length:537 start_codon:yes stop_codon:yes gene_type:complete